MKQLEQRTTSWAMLRDGLPTMALANALLLMVAGGCTLIPEGRQREVLHNPFPQLKRVAVLPFYNQSQQPNVDGLAVASAYYAALQSVPGFEVMPVGVADLQSQQYAARFGPPQSGADFQRMAQAMGVEAIVVGSVTDFDGYYPPRMAMTTHWYAANEGFHAIPPGYGLPWGTKQAEKIPARIVREAEFELARSQLQTQTPVSVADAKSDGGVAPTDPNQRPSMTPSPDVFDFPSADERGNPLRANSADAVAKAAYQAAVDPHRIELPGVTPVVMTTDYLEEPVLEPGEAMAMDVVLMEPEAIIPAGWPDPTDLIPDPPAQAPPVAERNHEPVLTHTRLYRGDDPYFTERLADYVETGDDARATSWQGYIKRSDDFVRFCCHLHLTEMLEARGGRDASNLILRWPVSRY